MYSWIERDTSYSSYSLKADATLFNENLQIKPAYYAIEIVLNFLLTVNYLKTLHYLSV